MSAITRIGDLDIEDPGCVHHIREHLASGCPLEPLVEAVVPMDPEERAPLVAAMVAKAHHLIAARNEAANDAGIDLHAKQIEDAPKRGRGRPKSEARAELQKLAKETKVSEATIRRDAAKLAPPPEPIVPPPAKPVPIEKLILEYAAKVQVLAEEGEALLPKALAEPMEAMADTPKGQPRGGEWRINLRSRVMELGQAALSLRNVADDIKRGRARLALNDHNSVKAAREERAKKPMGLSDPPKTGLKVPKRVKVLDSDTGNLLAQGEPSGLPPVQETADAWADAGRIGIGPDDGGDDAF